MPTFIWIFLALAGCLFLIKITYVLSIAFLLPVTRGALYVSTSRVRVSAFLDAMPLKKGQFLVDLGCGDGRVLRMARKRYHIRAVGYELNPVAYLKAKLLCSRYKEIQVERSDFWKADLHHADVVFCYLFPDIMKKLSAKLKSELRPGTMVVSFNFSLPGFTPELILRPDSATHNDPIYVYRQQN